MMKKQTISIVESSYITLVLIFLILTLLKNLDVLSVPVNYQLFAYALPFFALPLLLLPKLAGAGQPRGTLPILLAAFLLAFLVRLFPRVHSSVPLGYDPGFYKYMLELYTSSLPQIPEADLVTWVRDMFPQGLPVLSDVMHLVAGTNSLMLINYLFPLLGALVVFPVFVVARNLFGQRVGMIASLLYAVSYAQFHTFAMFYFNNVLGLLFLLLAIHALEKRNYGMMAFMFAALGIFHYVEFLLFALILVPYFLLHRRVGIVFAALGTALLIAPFWLSRWEIIRDILLPAASIAATNIATGAEASGGTFIDLGTYIKVSLAYLPFAITGAACLVMRRNWNSLLFYFVINFIIAVFKVFFFRRFLIPLDIAMVILAAVGIENTLLNPRATKRVVAVAASILVIVATGTVTAKMANDARPAINDEQMAAIEWIRENTEKDAWVLATNLDGPWLLGWSQRRVIAPGLFQWDVHNEAEWLDFLSTADPEAVPRFLSAYQGTIYVYYARNSGGKFNLDKFGGRYFQKLRDDKAVIYKYLGGGGVSP